MASTSSSSSSSTTSIMKRFYIFLSCILVLCFVVLNSIQLIQQAKTASNTLLCMSQPTTTSTFASSTKASMSSSTLSLSYPQQLMNPSEDDDPDYNDDDVVVVDKEEDDGSSLWDEEDAADTATNQDHRKPILFVHFHKSGGTAVCKTIQQMKTIRITDANGQLYIRRRNEVDLNCNTPFSSPNINVDQVRRLQSCVHLLPYTMNEQYIPFTRNNFLAVEIPFSEEMPCYPGQFRSMALMRHPITRLLSHIRVHKFTETRVLAYIKNKHPAPSHYYMDGYPIINNMVIRQLLGRKRFVDTTSPITDDDFQRAKQLVDQFDVFVPMEQLYVPTVQNLLQEKIPEYHAALVKRNMTQQQYLRAQYQYNNVTATFLELLRKENLYDLQLYHYVHEKLGLQV